jgi:hypothetical protein
LTCCPQLSVRSGFDLEPERTWRRSFSGPETSFAFVENQTLRHFPSIRLATS